MKTEWNATRGEVTCTLDLQTSLNTQQMLLESIVDDISRNKVYVRRVTKIGACHVIEKNNRVGLMTEGFNYRVINGACDVIDENSWETNDIAQVYERYGIEAGRRSIISEIASVLNVYGLDVNYRHLSLIGDHMTRTGKILPMTRGSMNHQSSPFLRITFERAMHYMQDACLHRDVDDLRSPASSIIVGQIGRFGTGAFEVMQDLDFCVELAKEKKRRLREEGDEGEYEDGDEEYEDEEEYEY